VGGTAAMARTILTALVLVVIAVVVMVVVVVTPSKEGPRATTFVITGKGGSRGCKQRESNNRYSDQTVQFHWFTSGSYEPKHNKPQVLGEYNFRASRGGYLGCREVVWRVAFQRPRGGQATLYRVILKTLRVRLERV
jgi:hypothetical protein